MTENEKRLKREHVKLTNPDKSIEGMGTVRFIVKCNHDAPNVLSHAKEILLIANEHAIEYGPESRQWLSVFPQWFLDACRPEKSPEEETKEAKRIANLP